MAATPNQYAPIYMHVTQNAKWQLWEKQEGKEKLMVLCLLAQKHTAILYVFQEKGT